jgi:hypothetical protein
MTVKQYLNQLCILKQKADQKRKELKHVKQESLICNRSGALTGKVQTSFSRTGSPTERYAIRLSDLENAVNESILTYLEERDGIVDQIHELDNSSYIEVLHKRYVEDIRNFENIACDMGYSYQYVLNIHAEALKAFENRFPELF